MGFGYLLAGRGVGSWKMVPLFGDMAAKELPPPNCFFGATE